MTTAELHRRIVPAPGKAEGLGESPPAPGLSGIVGMGKPLLGLGDRHPSGRRKHGLGLQILRGAVFVVYFFSSIISIIITQLIGAPLYFVNAETYYNYVAFTKKAFAIVATTMTQLWGPTLIRISGDPDVADQIRVSPNGMVEFAFPERMVLIANHQIYTDWLYLWWVGYANSPGMHGHIYIVLKESLKYIPFLGIGMMFYGFIFMSRKMAVDQPRLAHRLGKLKARRQTELDASSRPAPMWLLLFPEGTNLSDNGRAKSAQWAEKKGIKDPQHVLLPRSTGIFFCLNELKDTVEYVYDCTMAYEGVPHGEQYFTLSGIYFQGRPPKSVNFYWRRFRLADMPLHSQEGFDVWLRKRWEEKDGLMEQYIETGRFPPTVFPIASGRANGPEKKGYVETQVRTQYPWEFLQAFVVPGAVYYLYCVSRIAWARLLLGLFGER